MNLSNDPDNVTKNKLTSAILTWSKQMENPNNITKKYSGLIPKSQHRHFYQSNQYKCVVQIST